MAVPNLFSDKTSGFAGQELSETTNEINQVRPKLLPLPSQWLPALPGRGKNPPAGTEIVKARLPNALLVVDHVFGGDWAVFRMDGQLRVDCYTWYTSK